MNHQTWLNLIKDAPNQFNTSHPQQFDLIGIGINKYKTYNTGKVIYTGLTRHAMADRDALAALGELLAFEVHHGLRLLKHKTYQGCRRRVGQSQDAFPRLCWQK